MAEKKLSVKQLERLVDRLRKRKETLQQGQLDTARRLKEATLSLVEARKADTRTRAVKAAAGARGRKKP